MLKINCCVQSVWRKRSPYRGATSCFVCNSGTFWKILGNWHPHFEYFELTEAFIIICHFKNLFQLLASNLKLGHLVPRQQLSTEEIGSFHNKVGTVLEPGTEHLAKQGGKLSTVWWMLVKLELYWILSDLIESLLVILEKILIFGEVPRWEKFSVLGKKIFRKGIGGRPIFMNSFRLFWKSFTKNGSIWSLEFYG